jgi:hypothetical protein
VMQQPQAQRFRSKLAKRRPRAARSAAARCAAPAQAAQSSAAALQRATPTRSTLRWPHCCQHPHHQRLPLLQRWRPARAQAPMSVAQLQLLPRWHRPPPLLSAWSAPPMHARPLSYSRRGHRGGRAAFACGAPAPPPDTRVVCSRPVSVSCGAQQMQQAQPQQCTRAHAHLIHGPARLSDWPHARASPPPARLSVEERRGSAETDLLPVCCGQR